MKAESFARQVRRWFYAAAALLLFAACRDDPTEPEPLVPTTVEVIRGGGLEVLEDADGRDSLAVRVYDQHDDPMAGVKVTWSLLAGGGEVIPSEALTNDAGEASAIWLLGAEPGEGEIEARVEKLEPVLFAGVVEALPPDPTATGLVLVAGDGQTGQVGDALGDSLVVRVSDQNGEPMTGATVTWSTESGSLRPDDSVTDEAGEARAEWTLGDDPGEVQATASVEGLDPVTFTATAETEPQPEAGPPDSIVVVSGDNQTGYRGETLEEPLVIRLIDAEGRGVPGVPVSWWNEIPENYEGFGGISATDTTDAEGYASAEWPLADLDVKQYAAVYVYRGDIQPYGELWAWFEATAKPHPDEPPEPRRAVVVSGDHQASMPGFAVPEPLVASVYDQHNKLMPNEEVRWYVGWKSAGCLSVPGEEGCAEELVLLTDQDGRTQVEWTLGSDPAQRQRVFIQPTWERTASGDYNPTWAEFHATAIERVAAELEPVGSRWRYLERNGYDDPIYYGGNGIVNHPLADPVAVRVLDQFGLPMEGARIYWHVRNLSGAASTCEGVSSVGHGHVTEAGGGESGGDIYLTTDSSGESVVEWTMGCRVGDQRLYVRIEASEVPPIDLVVNVGPDL